MTTLWDLSPQQSASILGLKDSSETQRLLALGLTPTTPVLCLQSTMFGGPKVYQVHDQILSLSQECAQLIEVKLLSDTTKGGA